MAYGASPMVPVFVIAAYLLLVPFFFSRSRMSHTNSRAAVLTLTVTSIAMVCLEGFLLFVVFVLAVAG